MFLDFAIAIITAVVYSHYQEISIIPLIFFTLSFSVLPDLDFIIFKLLRIQLDKGYKHRDLFHYPLLYLPIGFLLIYLFSRNLAWIFLFISIFHFVHDSIAYGRGIKWLFPFSKNSYSFIYMYSRTVKWGLWQWVFVFNKKNVDKWDDEHGDEEWLQNIYYNLHPIAVVEFLMFFISLIILLAYELGWIYY